MKRKALSLIIVATMFTATLTNSPAAASTTPSAGSALPIVKNKLSIDFLCSSHPTKIMTGKEPMFQELEKRTNIHLNHTLVPDTGYSERFQITLSSGKIPDLITTPLQDSKKYGPDGAFLPLNKLLKENGANILSAIDANEVLGDITAADGNIYILPKFEPYSKPRTYMIRTDWLKKLKLEVPNTMDDLYTVLKAFKVNNMGGEQTIPLSSFGLNLLENIFRSFNAQNDPGYRIIDGKYTYSPISDNMKEALTFLNKLYKEDLLDKEFMTLSKNQWEAKANLGVVGVIAYSASRMDQFTKLYRKNDPTADMSPFAPPIGPDGKRHAYKDTSSLSDSYNVAISSQSKYAKELVQYFNYIFSEEGRTLLTYGIEGETYTVKNGKPQYTEKFLSDPDAETKYAIFGRRMPVWPIDVSEELIGGTKELESYKMNAQYLDAPPPVLTFLPDELDVLKKFETSINDKKDAYILKFITGVEPLSSWNKYVTEIKALNLDKCLDVYNAAYVRYKKAMQ